MPASVPSLLHISQPPGAPAGNTTAAPTTVNRSAHVQDAVGKQEGGAPARANVFHHGCSGRGSVGPPQLKAGDSVARNEVCQRAERQELARRPTEAAFETDAGRALRNKLPQQVSPARRSVRRVNRGRLAANVRRLGEIEPVAARSQAEERGAVRSGVQIRHEDGSVFRPIRLPQLEPVNPVVRAEIKLAAKGHDTLNSGTSATRVDVTNHPGACERAVGPPELVPVAAIAGGEIQNVAEDGLEFHAEKSACAIDGLGSRCRSVAERQQIRTRRLRRPTSVRMTGSILTDARFPVQG